MSRCCVAQWRLPRVFTAPLRHIRAIDRQTVVLIALVMEGSSILTTVPELALLLAQSSDSAAAITLASFARPGVEFVFALFVLAVLDYQLIRSRLSRRGARTPEPGPACTLDCREVPPSPEFGRVAWGHDSRVDEGADGGALTLAER